MKALGIRLQSICNSLYDTTDVSLSESKWRNNREIQKYTRKASTSQSIAISEKETNKLMMIVASTWDSLPFVRFTLFFYFFYNLFIYFCIFTNFFLLFYSPFNGTQWLAYIYLLFDLKLFFFHICIAMCMPQLLFFFILHYLSLHHRHHHF